MKKLLIAFFTLLALPGMAQYTIEGTVYDNNSAPVPGVRIIIENSAYGALTTPEGNYLLNLPRKGTYILVFKMLGFATLTDTVVVTQKKTINDITLREDIKELSTVEVYGDKKDLAKEIIQNVIDNKKNLENQFENYQCTSYTRTVLNTETQHPMLESGKDSLEHKMTLTESYSITSFIQPSAYHEQVIAYHDYTEKEILEPEYVPVYFYQDDMVPQQTVEFNPYVFYEKLEDGDVDPYENMLYLPKISLKQLVSPLAVNAFLNYKYTLAGSFYEGDTKIYEIIVEPRFNEGPFFEGRLFIIDSLWVIKSMDLNINKGALQLFREFRVIQEYEKINGKWVCAYREFNYIINDREDLVTAKTKVHHTDYIFDAAIEPKDFKNAVIAYNDDAYDKDTTYWMHVRPEQLPAEELNYIRERDSIREEVNSIAYIDSVNAEYNKVTFFDVVLNGVGYRNRATGKEFYINPLISQPQLFGVGGYRHRLGGMYSMEFENAHKLRLTGSIDYGFRYKDVKGELEAEYTFLPKRFGSFTIRGGDMYDIVNNYESVLNSFSIQNLVRKQFIGFSQRYELVNGLYGRAGFDYSTRIAIDNLQLAPWLQSALDTLGIDATAEPFPTYTVSIFQLELLYRFKQQYVIKGGKKLIIGTVYPELRLNYKIGVPGLLGSDVNFSYIEFGASDEVKFGTFGNLKWNYVAGTFLGPDVDNINFIEHKFFRGSDYGVVSNPLRSLQLLDSTFHTSRPYMQAFAVHHFNGAITDKIPLINKTKIELMAGGGWLWIDDLDFNHAEVFVGIERVLKVRKQLLKVNMIYVVRNNNASGFQINLKVGGDYFNSFTNSWLY